MNQYVYNRWYDALDNLELELRNHPDSQQWMDIDILPETIEKIIQKHCKIFPFKTNSLEKLELILEHSLISGIQCQLIFVLDFNLAVSNAVHGCFHRIQETPLFNKVMEEFRVFWNAAETIKHQWIQCFWNPEYLTCRNRLLRDFDEFSNWMQSFSTQACL